MTHIKEKTINENYIKKLLIKKFSPKNEVKISIIKLDKYNEYYFFYLINKESVLGWAIYTRQNLSIYDSSGRRIRDLYGSELVIENKNNIKILNIYED